MFVVVVVIVVDVILLIIDFIYSTWSISANFYNLYFYFMIMFMFRDNSCCADIFEF